MRQGARRGVHADELDDPSIFFSLGQQLELAAAEDIDLDEDDETGQAHSSCLVCSKPAEFWDLKTDTMAVLDLFYGCRLHCRT